MKSAGNYFIIEPIVENKSELLVFAKPIEKNYGEVISPPFGTRKPMDNVIALYIKTGVIDFRHEGKDYVKAPASSVIAYFTGKVSPENISIPSNYVLVEVTHDPSKIDLAGNEFFIDTSWKKEFHAPTFGVVAALPDKLICKCVEVHQVSDMDEKRRIIADSLPWDTTLEISLGDTVHFDYLQESVCKRDGLILEADGKKYFLINYSQLYAAENGGEIRLLNGYMAVDIPEEEKVAEIGSQGLLCVNLKDADKRKQWGEGVIRYAGTPNGTYALWNIDERMFEVSAGDTIVFKDTKRSKFGQDMHIRCKELKGLYRVQRKDIHFVKHV